MAWPRGYPSLQFYPTVEGCAYSEAFAVVVYLRKIFAAAWLSLSRSRPNLPHQLLGLLKRDVMLLREVVSVIGGVRGATSDTATGFL